jgi:hypothetical protein
VKISGFTLVKNAVALDFPIEAAIRSILPLCDEVVVNVGRSDDGTLELIRGIGDPRIRILETEWGTTRGSTVLREETDRAMRAAVHPFGIYIQADEVLHEAGLGNLRSALERASRDDRIDGVAVRYRHLFGSPGLEAVGRRWYRREVRAVRLAPAGRIHSFRDAQGFRVGPDDRRLRALVADAEMFHYGYLRSAAAMRGRRAVDQALGPAGRTAPPDPAVLSWFPGIRPFRGTHPAAAAAWVAAHGDDPDRRIAPARMHPEHLRYAASNLIERLTGIRPFEFRNFDPVE